MIISYSTVSGTGSGASANVTTISAGSILGKFNGGQEYCAVCAAIVSATVAGAVVTCTGYNYRRGTEHAYAYLMS